MSPEMFILRIKGFKPADHDVLTLQKYMRKTFIKEASDVKRSLQF
jgi:hypothetical protein